MNYIQRVLSGADNTASSRRFITFVAMIVAVIVDISIIILAFKVALATGANANAIEAIDKLIQLSMVVWMVIFLLAGVITWQNINESAKIIKGMPTDASSLQTTVKQEVTQIATDIKNGGIDGNQQ